MTYGSPIAGTKQQMWGIGETYRKEKKERDKEEQFRQETQKQIVGNVWDIYQKTQAEEGEKFAADSSYEINPAYEKSFFLAKPFIPASMKYRKIPEEVEEGVSSVIEKGEGLEKAKDIRKGYESKGTFDMFGKTYETMEKKGGGLFPRKTIPAEGVKKMGSPGKLGEGGEEIGLGEGSDVLGSVGKGINIAGDVSELSSSWKKNIKEGKGAKNVQNLASMAKYVPHPAFQAIGWASDISKLFT